MLGFLIRNEKHTETVTIYNLMRQEKEKGKKEQRKCITSACIV